ncbi:MAG TPA: hypothetical protein ENG51_07600 [Deltaproteobacteria bacterium]|nr:hypothetical protein [Deltaproteobacteria bacterium]
MEITKEIIAGINEVLKNDKFLGFLAVVILAFVVKDASPESMEWYKMALSGLFGAIVGHSLKR